MAMGKLYRAKRTRRGRLSRVKRIPRFGTLYRVVNKAIQKQKEHKYKENTISTDPTTSGTFNLLNGLQQGDDANTREGNRVKMGSIYIKGTMTNSDATSNQIRMVLFIDTQPNGAAPTEALLFQDNVAPENGALIEANSHRRFKILKDWHFNLSATAQSGDTRIIKYFKKLYGEVLYTGNVGDITDISKNSLYLYMTSTDASGGIVSSLDYRMRFTE